jgi:mannosyltransferase
MSTTAPRRKLPWLLQAPQVRDFGAPQWFERLPVWVSTGGVLLILMAISAVLRTRFIGGQFWSDEAVAVGVASHPLTAIPGILRQQGSAPLYYLILHIWINLFGSSETTTHALSLVFGLLSIPIAMWAGWSLAGRRGGIYAAVLFTFCAFLTEYAQETQAYELLALLGLIAAASYLHALIYRRRVYLIPLAITLALMLYTSFWAIFFWAGAAIALIPIWVAADDRRGVLSDAAIAFGVGLLLFVPWIPNLVYQMGHTTSPWGFADFMGATFPSNLLGGDRVVVALAISGAVGALPLLTADMRRTREATTVWALIALPFAAVLVARLASLIAVTWVTRYFAPLVAPLLLLAAFTSARAGIMGLIALVLSVAFVVNVASFVPKYKSDVRDVAGEIAPYMRPGDVVLTGEPEQTPLAWYYLPAGLRYATLTGPVKDPSYMNWVNAYSNLKDSNPAAMESALVSSLKPGQRLLYSRPLTEGAKFWKQPWSQLVRRRSAQWGALLAADPRLRPVAGAVAPHSYPGSCCVADSAVVYSRVG